MVSFVIQQLCGLPEKRQGRFDVASHPCGYAKLEEEQAGCVTVLGEFDGVGVVLLGLGEGGGAAGLVAGEFEPVDGAVGVGGGARLVEVEGDLCGGVLSGAGFQGVGDAEVGALAARQGQGAQERLANLLMENV